MSLILTISHPNVDGGTPYELPWLEPLDDGEIDIQTVNTTADGNVFVDDFGVKKNLTTQLSWVDIEIWEKLKEFKDAQRLSNTFCVANIPERDWVNVVVFLTITPGAIINNGCMMESVTINLRETDEEE